MIFHRLLIRYDYCSRICFSSLSNFISLFEFVEVVGVEDVEEGSFVGVIEFLIFLSFLQASSRMYCIWFAACWCRV